MGTGQSKNLPDVQMRRKMESGFDDDDDDIDGLGLSDRGGVIDRARSKSNLSFHKSERFHQNEEDEYFNKIYSKRAEKSLNSLTNSALAVKSAPAGPKKDKDPEVAAAIAELEETFKVLGDGPAVKQDDLKSENVLEEVGGTTSESSATGRSEAGSTPSISVNEYVSSPTNSIDNSTGRSENSETNVLILQSDDESGPLPCDRQLISRAGEDFDQNGFIRRPSKHLDLNGRGIATGSSGVSSSITPKSRGGDARNLLVSSHSNSNMRNNGRLHTQSHQSILMQQRREFQIQRRHQNTSDGNNKGTRSKSHDGSVENREESVKDWNYEPPKIEGFDIDKFKEINSKIASAKTIVPIMMSEEEEDKGYYSRSPDIPSYTKDELDLIASLEREVY